MNMTISIVSDTATPALRQTIAMLRNKGPLVGAMGRRLIHDTSLHVMQWGIGHPNKLGGRRTNYWGRIAQKINPGDCLQVQANSATVTLGGPTMPGLMRAFGDITIFPGTKTAGVKYLAIPARAESYGMRAREFGNLVRFWKGKGRVGGLAEAVTTTRTRKTSKGEKGSEYFRPGLIMYWFADSVTVPQDRSILPSEQEWSESVNAGATDWVNLELRKIKGGA